MAIRQQLKKNSKAFLMHRLGESFADCVIYSSADSASARHTYGVPPGIYQEFKKFAESELEALGRLK